MTKTQVNNIINFSFHFHQSMGCKIKEFSPDYLEEKFKSFVSKLDQYKPRDFIIENLSIEKCEDKLLEVIDKINI